MIGAKTATLRFCATPVRKWRRVLLAEDHPDYFIRGCGLLERAIWGALRWNLGGAGQMSDHELGTRAIQRGGVEGVRVSVVVPLAMFDPHPDLVSRIRG